ncbi:hypothetical protein J2R96_000296 [Bradyrhizobium elkanii]|nr:hypothetical protein [Bradyrhizobium elkanii]
MISARKLYDELSSFAAMPPGPAGQKWLQDAEQDALEFLQRQSDFTVVYAMFRHLWVVSVFSPAARLKKPSKKKLYNARIEVGSSWCMQKVWGGGEGHRIYLEPPLDFESRHPLRGTEYSVQRRSRSVRS